MWRKHPYWLLFLALFLVPACGSRTTLTTGRTDAAPSLDGGRDGGADGGLDGGTDAGPPDELILDCGRSVQYTSPRRPITLIGMATSPAGISTQVWSLVDQPVRSSPTVVPGALGEVTLTPDLEGDYLMRFDVSDGRGRAASCEVTVQSVVGPPVAICPEEPLATTINVATLVEGDGFDDEMVVGYTWEIVDQPMGSRAAIDPTDEPIISFLTPTRGEYLLRLTVVDFDMATGSCEVPITVTGPPEVECPDTIRAPTRQAVGIAATATDDVGLESESWEMVSAPADSTAMLRSPDNPTRLVPDKQGNYVLRFTATDVEGLSASCETTVVGTPTPPTVMCPAVVTTSPLTPVEITGTAVDDGVISRWLWSVVTRPGGSTAPHPSPRNRATTTFTPDIAGIYEVELIVTDNDGETANCITSVEAGNIDGLRIEVFWDTNGTDMDTHLMNPTGTMWTSEDDCYYGNCITRGGGDGILEWGAPGPDDNPRLDIDDTDGFGPENINITTPEAGTYRVAVHNFAGGGPNNTTVRIYCGGSTTEPRQTFGPVALRQGSDDFWRVADVEIDRGRCTITDLAGADGRPNISPHRRTQGMR